MALFGLIFISIQQSIYFYKFGEKIHLKKKTKTNPRENDLETERKKHKLVHASKHQTKRSRRNKEADRFKSGKKTKLKVRKRTWAKI